VILPPAEFVVANGGEGAPLLACGRFKYDAAYRERWGISMEFAALAPRESESLAALSLRACAALGIRDYGSLDVKLTPAGAWVFLEANPNPGLSPSGKVFTGASGGLDFETLVAAIASSALQRSGDGRASALGERAVFAERRIAGSRRFGLRGSVPERGEAGGQRGVAGLEAAAFADAARRGRALLGD